MTNCANCGTTNPDGAKFCLNCGTKLAQICPACGTELPADAKFCLNCGHRLTGGAASAPPATEAAAAAPPAASPVAPLDRFMPRELAQKLSQARATGEMLGERRVVTMLFCDVKGSTAAAARFDPEEWAEIINGAFEPMIGPIYRYEGTVARLMGDGLLAFFGAPIAHEDDPQRAVLAGLEILAGIGHYREAVQRQWGLDLDVRVGVNTGLVVVGAVGSDLRMEYSALGDAINIAARMEQTAQPGTVQIAPATYKLVAPLFDFETIANLEVKGRAEPMTAYRVLGRRAAPGATRGLAGLSSPLVGREAELGQVVAALTAVSAGRGGIVTIAGEAGLGKSRLVAEARQDAAAGRSLWLEGKSLSFETAAPFAPFQRALPAAAGLAEGGDPAAGYARLCDAIDALLPGRGEETAPFVAQAMGLPVPAAEEERIRYLPPPMLRGLVFGAVVGWLEALAGARPTVLYLDDVHWADPTSLELLHALMPVTDRAPLLLLLALRPRPQDASWQLYEAAARDYGHRFTPVRLQPLAEADSRALVRNLLAIEDLPERVRQLILDKSEGNPFFLEEVIRSLLDAGLVVRQGDHWRATREVISLRVPDTLVGVITARLDRLDDAARQTAQAAAVLGREFTYAVLAEIAGQGAALDESLAILQRRDLIREATAGPERRYVFRHALTQDAAYESLLMSRRRHLHQMAADVLRRRAPDEAAEIARHYLEARQPGAALPFLVRAGQAAAAAYAAQEAIDFFSRVIENEQVGDLATARAAYEGLAGLQSLSADPRPAQATYQRMLAAAEARGDRPMTVSALNKLGGLLALMMGRFDQAESYLSRAEELVEETDAEGQAELGVIRCQMCVIAADFEGVLGHMNTVVSSSLKAGNDFTLSVALAHTAQSQVFLNQYEEARATAEEALALTQRISDRPREIDLQTFIYPLILIRDGEFDRAMSMIADGLHLARRVGLLDGITTGLLLTADIHRLRGDYEAALAAGQGSMEAATPLEDFLPFYMVHALSELGTIYLEITPRLTDNVAQLHRHALALLDNPIGAIGGGIAWADLGWCALTLGDDEVAGEMFARGLSAPSMMINMERPRYLAGAALVSARRGDQAEAVRLAEEACALVEQYAMRHRAPLVRLSYGRVLAAGGAHEAALAQFEIAATAAAALGMAPLRRQAQAATSTSLRALGRDAEAGQQQAAAEATAEGIAARMSDESLRREYLSAGAGQRPLPARP